MTSAADQFRPFAARMRAAGLPDISIANFRYYYEQLLSGHTGLIPESDIEPVTGLPDLDEFADDPGILQAGREAAAHTVMIKLNGGLGTSMGLQKAKTLLRVKGDLTFLDIIARQAQRKGVPLLLMNSFNTQADSLAALDDYPRHPSGLPWDFLQHKVPKVVQADLSPAAWPADPELEWNPPGHGDIYIALATSGMLARLSAAGFRYAFISNADNLGAVLHDAILGYFVTQRLPFMLEVTERTPSDRKGGHLARTLDGRLILRETAQCRPEDTAHFQDVHRHPYFNTNNLWLDLSRLEALLAERENVLRLPMIRNAKTVDPRDPDSTPVYQLETAMGSAVSVFAGAGAVRVPRHRFAAVKTTDDLLGVRSDAFVLTDDDRVVPAPQRRAGPVITLDIRYYRLIDDLEARFPFGPPSLVSCDELRLDGDVRFGSDVTLMGTVRLGAGDIPLNISDGAAIAGMLIDGVNTDV